MFGFGANILPKICPFINKQFSIDFYLDWEGHHWIFAHLNQTTATRSLELCEGAKSETQWGSSQS